MLLVHLPLNTSPSRRNLVARVVHRKTQVDAPQGTELWHAL